MYTVLNKQFMQEIFLQLFPALIATISSLCEGMQYGWSAPLLPILRSENSPVKIIKIDEYWLETSYLIGGVAGVPVTIYMMDNIGPRMTIMVASCTGLISWIIMALTAKVEYLYVARVIAGVVGDVSHISTPMYLTEIANQQIRGFLGGLDYLMMMIGILVIYSVAPFVPYYVPHVIGAVLLAIQVIALPFIPESPYYLVNKGKFAEAKKSLGRLRNRDNNDNELENIAEAVKSRANETGSYKDFFLIKHNRKVLIIIIVLVGSQHFSGFNIMLMHLHTILEETDSSFLKPEQTGIMFAILIVVGTGICSLSVDKFGKKILLSVSGILTGICCMTIAIYFTLENLNRELGNISWIVAAAAILYGLSFALGLNFIPQLLICELLTTNIKVQGLAYGDGLYVVLGSAALSFYHYCAYNHVANIPFFVFSVVSFSSVIFTVLVIPETKGKSLRAIQVMLRGDNIEAPK